MARAAKIPEEAYMGLANKVSLFQLLDATEAYHVQIIEVTKWKQLRPAFPPEWADANSKDSMRIQSHLLPTRTDASLRWFGKVNPERHHRKPN